MKDLPKVAKVELEPVTPDRRHRAIPLNHHAPQSPHTTNVSKLQPKMLCYLSLKLLDEGGISLLLILVATDLPLVGPVLLIQSTPQLKILLLKHIPDSSIFPKGIRLLQTRIQLSKYHKTFLSRYYKIYVTLS